MHDTLHFFLPHLLVRSTRTNRLLGVKYTYDSMNDESSVALALALLLVSPIRTQN